MFMPMNSWTNDAASRHTSAPISHTRFSAYSHKLLLICHLAEGRRLSCLEHKVGLQLAQGCLQITHSEGVEIQAECYNSDNLPLDHLHLTGTQV